MSKDEFGYGLRRKKNLIRISLISLHHPPHLSFHVTIACLKVIAHHHVSSKDMVFQVGSTSGFPEETKRILTHKDPKLIGYLNLLSNFFCRCVAKASNQCGI